MSDTGGFPDLTGLLARVTENPQAISMLSSLLGGSVASKPSQKEEKEEPPQKEECDAIPVIAPPKRHTKGRQEDRRRLLIALKPFLSKERCQALDTLLIVLDAISLLPSGKEPPCT